MILSFGVLIMKYHILFNIFFGGFFLGGGAGLFVRIEKVPYI